MCQGPVSGTLLWKRQLLLWRLVNLSPFLDFSFFPETDPDAAVTDRLRMIKFQKPSNSKQ